MNDKDYSNKQVVIALDAMGGDHAPESIIKGADIIASNNHYNVHFKIYGNKDVVIKILNKMPLLKQKSELIHAEQVVGPNEIPSNAIRNCRQSSMQLAINAVKEKEADAMVSAGNTGALMAMSTITLRTLPQIHRPAIVALLPTLKGRVAILDLGANVECDANNLYQFAIMGDVFAKILLGIKNPKVALLNIGSEDIKGKDSIKLAHAILSEKNTLINYSGYIEGNEIAEGLADVVVADGFSGNVMLKSIEGYAKVYVDLTKKAFSHNFLSKLSYFVSRPTLKKLATSLDKRQYNGALLVGLNGIVVKSHGSMDEIGVANAINTAYELVHFKANEKIAEELSQSINS
jgi:phosphate acyltransferase